MRDYVGIASAYISDVLAGEISACHWVRQACQRQLNDLARKRWQYRFDVERAGAVCEFIELLPHVKGRYTARLQLEPWQVFILTTVFGWIDAAGFRRFRTAYTEVPRKNGKSTLSSGVALYMLAADGEPGAEVYSAATTRDQARIVFGDAQKMVKKDAELREGLGLQVAAAAIFQPDSSSTFKALSRDQDGNLDGLNIHCAVIDELHGHKDRGVWDVTETGTGARKQSLLWSITTSGFNRAGICYEQRIYVTKILDRVHVDETYFGIIFTIDEGDDWRDPEVWAKANPNYGVSVEPDDLKRKATKAEKMAAAQNNFLTKHLNVWVNADTSWMNMPAWEKCGDPSLSDADFEGEECTAACDLASKIDIAARVKLFRRVLDGLPHYYLFANFYLPEDALEESSNSQYSGWAKDGHLTLTDGAAIDFGEIEADLQNDARRFSIAAAGFDPWQSAQIMTRLSGEGMPVVEYRQTVQNMSEPMKELEALVLDGRFHHTGCPVLTWMVSCVVCHTDAKENIYPRKERPENKIDGVVAAIMALGLALNSAPPVDLDDLLDAPLEAY